MEWWPELTDSELSEMARTDEIKMTPEEIKNFRVRVISRLNALKLESAVEQNRSECKCMIDKYTV